MTKMLPPALVAGLAAALLPSLASAAVIGPYTADANTLALFHFNESSGVSDPGNPFVNAGSAGTSLDLANTGGPDGRSNLTTGGYGATAYTGFGSSFNALGAGDGTYHSGGSGSAVGGGAITTSQTILQSSLQGGTGAFTLEAMVNFSSFTVGQEYTILSHDGPGNGANDRGFLFRIDTAGNLSFYTGSTSVTAVIPTTGANALSSGQWFHLALTYNGSEGAANNVSFYWTALDSGATQANLIGNATLAADLNGNSSNAFGVGTTTRSQFRLETPGLIDEVRISDIARGADDFIFGVVPEPTTSLLCGSGLLATLIIRRRR